MNTGHSQAGWYALVALGAVILSLLVVSAGWSQGLFTTRTIGQSEATVKNSVKLYVDAIGSQNTSRIGSFFGSSSTSDWEENASFRQRHPTLGFDFHSGLTGVETGSGVIMRYAYLLGTSGPYSSQGSILGLTSFGTSFANMSLQEVSDVLVNATYILYFGGNAGPLGNFNARIMVHQLWVNQGGGWIIQSEVWNWASWYVEDVVF